MPINKSRSSEPELPTLGDIVVHGNLIISEDQLYKSLRVAPTGSIRSIDSLTLGCSGGLVLQTGCKLSGGDIVIRVDGDILIEHGVNFDSNSHFSFII